MADSIISTIATQEAVCVKNEGYAVSLEPRKIYSVVPDEAARMGFARIIDESGEDYLYPADFFVPVELPPKTREALRLTLPSAV